MVEEYHTSGMQKIRTLCGTILAAVVAATCTAVAADVGDSIPAQGVTQAWRPSVRWRGFNLLGMFCQTKMENGDKRISGYFPEDRFQWMEEWGFNFARLPLDYRFFVEKGDWMKPVEAQLEKLDEAVRYGKKHGVHVQINLHRAPGYCCNPPQEPKSLFRDPEPLAAFTNLWSVLAGRSGISTARLASWIHHAQIASSRTSTATSSTARHWNF